MNTKKQGDIGLGAAIRYFTLKGITVCVPLTDSQEYDLVIDMHGLQRVQVKHTSYKRTENYEVSLSVKGGNRTSKGTVKKFDVSKVDMIFVATICGEWYLIPTETLTVSSVITLNNMYDQYKVS